MNVLILYATTEGHTRRIARFAARRLQTRGASVELLPLGEAAAEDLADRDRVLVLASVHNWRFQSDLTEFAQSAGPALAAARATFATVSLAAVSSDPEDRASLEGTVARLTAATGWHPEAVLHLGGALRWGAYDFLEGWAMRYLASRIGGTSPGQDSDHTDYEALGQALDAFAGDAPTASRPLEHAGA